MRPLDDPVGAIAAWNVAHPIEPPTKNRRCPACEHVGCWGLLPQNPYRWFCFSSQHEVDGDDCGRKTSVGYFGDALDLEAHVRDCSRIDVLIHDGYLSPRHEAVRPTPRPSVSVTRPSRPPRRIVSATPPEIDILPLVELAVIATPDAWLRRHAESLALPPDSALRALRRLRVHRHSETVSGWPMRDDAGRVIGIRYRGTDGRKWSYRGGREGLFVPDDLAADGLLLLPEGASDTAVLLTLGFEAAGRPSCATGLPHCRQLARHRDVIVVADADAPGRTGAEALAAKLTPLARSVRVIQPPPPFKDVRAWVGGGARPNDVQDLIHNAKPWKVDLRESAGGTR